MTGYRDNRVALRRYLGALLAEADTQLSQIHKTSCPSHRFLAWT